MRNAKKTLSLVMIAIFTTFIVLSGIPTSAVTKSSKAKVTAAAKAAAAKKVAAAKAAAAKAAAAKVAAAKAAAAKAVVTNAIKAVENAEALTNADTYDLVGNDKDLENAQNAVTAALEAIVKLNKDSADYKGLMARVDAANSNVVKAMDDKDAAAAATAAAAAQVKAIAAADTAVSAVEKAPLATQADVTAVLDLGKTAVTAVAAVSDLTKAADYKARLATVNTAALALQAKLVKAAEDAKLPAKIVTVSAVDGTITVTFDKKPLTTPVAADFTVTKSVGGAAAVAVTPSAIVTTDAAATLTVAPVLATTADQSVTYNVTYTTGSPIAVTYTVAKLGAPTVTATAANTFVATFAKAATDTTKVVFTVKRDSVVVAMPAAWNTDKTVATLTYGGVIPEGTYTVNTTVDTTDFGTQTVVVTKQKVSKIEIAGTTLAVGPITGNPAVAGKGYISYKVYDQYGVDITALPLASSSNIIWTSSVGTVVASKGLLTITSFNDSTVFLTQYTTTVVTALCSDSAVSMSKSVNISAAQGTLSDIKLNKVTNVDNKEIVGNDTLNKFYVNFTATDINGNVTSDKTLLEMGILFNGSGNNLFSSNPSLLNARLIADPADSAKDVIELVIPNTVSMYQDTPVTITVMTKTGKSSTITVNVKKPAQLDSLQLMSPAVEVSADNTGVTIPFIAYDQNGKQLTSYNDIMNDNCIVSFTAGMKFIKNADGTLKITTGDVLLSKDVTTIFQVVTKTGKSSMISIKPSTATAANELAVDASVVQQYMQQSSEQYMDFGIDMGGFSVTDQYGRTIDMTNGSTATYNGVTTSYNVVVASNSDNTVITTSGTAYDGNAIYFDAANKAGTATLTLNLLKTVTGDAVPANNVTNAVISTKTLTFTVVKDSDIVGITNDAYATIYANLDSSFAGTSQAKYSHSATADTCTYGKLSNGAAVTLNSTTYGNIKRYVDNSTFMVSGGAVYAKKLDTGVAEVTGNVTSSVVINGTMLTVTSPIKAQSAAQIAKSIGINITTMVAGTSTKTGFSKGSDTVTGTVAAINELTAKSLFKFDSLGTGTTSNVYFYVYDQYGRKAMNVTDAQVISQTDITNAAITKYSISKTTGLLSIVGGTSTIGDTFVISVTANNGTTMTEKFVVSGAGIVAASLSSIAITTPATKTAYNVGDVLDLTGLVVTGTYSNTTTKAQTITASNVTGFDNTTPGTQILVITVGGKTTAYSVTVSALVTLTSVAVSTPATKLTYKVGETLDTTDLVITGTYSDASTAVLPVTSVTGFNSSAPNVAQTIIVVAGGKATTYTVVISPYTADETFALTTPAPAAGNTIATVVKAVTVHVVNATGSVVITGALAAGQTAVKGGVNAANVTVDNTTATAPTYTVDTTGIAAAGGTKTFTITVSEAAMSDITFTVTVIVAAP
jgi:hypothetical protein